MYGCLSPSNAGHLGLVLRGVTNHNSEQHNTTTDNLIAEFIYDFNKEMASDNPEVDDNESY